MSRGAFITGWGVVAAGAIGAQAFTERLFSGQSAIAEVTSFDVEGLPCERAAEAAEFDAAAWLRTPKNFLDRNSELAFAACEMAVRHARLELPTAAAPPPGVAIGSAAANLATLAGFQKTLEQKGPRLVPPFIFPHTYANTTASLLSIEYGLGGPHAAFTSGGAAGSNALAWAAEAVASGATDTMLAGGVEAFSEPLYRGTAATGWLAMAKGGEACLPFSPSRRGTVLGEAAAVFAVETASERPLARLAASGISATARGAMSAALDAAGVRPDLVVAAAGGYERLDEEEEAALTDLFGTGGVPVTAAKAMFGETLGASGPLNLAVALAAIERGMLPPTAGADARPLGGLDLVCEARPSACRCALVNAAHPDGGVWVSLVVVSPT